MKGKEIILLILIVAAGIIFYHAQTGKIWLDWEMDEGIFIGQDEFVYQETEEISPPFASLLIIDNAHGEVEVAGRSQDFISITLEKKIYRRKQQQADEAAKKLHMTIQQDDESILLSTNSDDIRNRRFRTNFRINVPEDMDIEVKNSYGEVRISQVQKAKVRNPYGKVFAADIAGDLDVDNSYRDVDVENVQADCIIDSHNGRVTAEGVEGNIEISHKYGKIHLEDIGRSATIEASNSEVFGQNITGSMDIRDSYRKVELTDVGPVKIRTRNSRIEIKGAKDNVDIEASYGKAELSDIRGDLRVDGKNLEVYGDSIIGDNIFISTSYRKVELIKFQGKTDVVHSNGKIDLEPLTLTGPIEVKGRYSDITFYWNTDDKNPIEARAKGGNIDWPESGALQRTEENGYSVVKANSQEKNLPSIFLSTTYGSIKIEEFKL
jgi:hypothetical protein